ncbi:hypothetical protein MLD59_16405 [Verrucomicrobiaceae bacterium E54]|nr:hypothetical protein [Verrucomicrobiaceae bacterium E54]
MAPDESVIGTIGPVSWRHGASHPRRLSLSGTSRRAAVFAFRPAISM